MLYSSETIVVGGILLISIFLKIIKFRKIFYSLRLPGPIPLPIVGNGLLFLNKPPAGTDIFKFYQMVMLNHTFDLSREF